MRIMAKFLFKYLVFVLWIFPFISFAADAANNMQDKKSSAIFAGGCFWCMQADFDKIPGVLKTMVGFTGGHVQNPTYAQVTNGGTGHYEAIAVLYDPKKVSYEQLLNVFWHDIDPTNNKGQFCDIGSQYKAVIFYQDENQKKLALASKEELQKSQKFKKIVTQILPANTFYRAEEEHQKYYQNHSLKYKFYRYTCGRDERLEKLWGKNKNSKI